MEMANILGIKFEIPDNYVYRSHKDQRMGIAGSCSCLSPMIVTEDGAQVCDGCYEFKYACRCDKYKKEE
jgi:hypothetical protein